MGFRAAVWRPRGAAFGWLLAKKPGGTDAGLHFVMGVRSVAVSEWELVRRAGELGVGLPPLLGFAAEDSLRSTASFDPASHLFVMNYAGVEVAAIPTAVAMLERVFGGVGGMWGAGGSRVRARAGVHIERVLYREAFYTERAVSADGRSP